MVSQMVQDNVIDGYKSLVSVLMQKLKTNLYIVPGAQDTDALTCG